MTKIDNEQLRLARERAGKTQIEMAKEFGVSLNTYALWERGGFFPSEKYQDAVKKFIGDIGISD